MALADPDVTVPALRAACERVLASSEHQERLIEALLTLARGQRGLDRHEHLDLATVARALTAGANAEASSRGLRLDVDLSPAPTAGDARLVERLVANLVDSALCHNVSGSMRVQTGIAEDRPTLCVTNSGPVIDPDQVSALFEPFRRRRDARTGDDGGLGLGLSIVAAIATAHGADIHATPVPDGGLTVRVAFPPVHTHHGDPGVPTSTTPA